MQALDVAISILGMFSDLLHWVWETIHGWIGFGFFLVFAECWSLRSQLSRLEQKHERLLEHLDEKFRPPSYDD